MFFLVFQTSVEDQICLEDRCDEDTWTRALELFYACPLGAFLDNELEEARIVVNVGRKAICLYHFVPHVAATSPQSTKKPAHWFWSNGSSMK